jgi:hypothetical protein
MLTFTSNPAASSSEAVYKLTLRIKATKTLYQVRLLLRSGLVLEAARMNKISKWYHTKSIELGYNSLSFTKDMNEINEYEEKFSGTITNWRFAA